MNGDGLIDLETLMELRQAAPHVTQVPFDLARAAVAVMTFFGGTHTPNEDAEGKVYWDTPLKTLAMSLDHGSVSGKRVGQVCREMGLTLWREGDGYHVAWSQAQLNILKRHFKVT